MTRLTLGLLTLASSTALAACVIVTDDDGGDDEVGETGDTGDTTGDGDTGTSTGDTTTTTGDTGTDTTTSTGDTDTSDATDTSADTGTTTSGDECVPPDENVSFSYQLEFGDIDWWDTDLHWSCEVLDADTTNGLAMNLDCPEANAPVSVEVTASPSFLPPIAASDIVDLHYVSEGPFWFNNYLRVDLQGYGHLLTLIDGDSLLPPEMYAFDSAIDFTRVYDLCEWVDGGCGQLERLALDFEVNGEMARLFDREYAIVGGDPGTEVWVAEASLLHEIQCTDTPDEWFRVLIANTGQE